MPLLPVVLQAEAQLLDPEVDPVGPPGRALDLDLELGSGQGSRVEPAQPGHRLGRRLRAGVRERHEHRAAGAPHACPGRSRRLPELVPAEGAETQHRVQRGEGRVPAEQPAEVTGRAQRRGHPDAEHLHDVGRPQEALSARGQVVAQPRSPRLTNTETRRHDQVVPRRQDHLGPVQPPGGAIGDHGIRGYDEPQRLAAARWSQRPAPRRTRPRAAGAGSPREHSQAQLIEGDAAAARARPSVNGRSSGSGNLSSSTGCPRSRYVTQHGAEHADARPRALSSSTGPRERPASATPRRAPGRHLRRLGGIVGRSGGAVAAGAAGVGLDGGPEVRRSTSGQSTSVKTISEYAACQSMKLLSRCSPEVRQTMSASASSGT